MVEHGRVFRVRKIDVARRLPLVRDLRELDNKGEDLRASIIIEARMGSA